MLELKHLSVRLGSVDIINDLHLHVAEGQWLMIVGPNGAGKSTIVHAISGALPYTGEILLAGQNIRLQNPNTLAKCMGILMQHHDVGYAFTVEEIVRLGRYAYTKGIFQTSSQEDDTMVQQALQDTGLLQIRNQSVLTLSGGELQRTFLAQVFAQNPKILILDEPTNHLDLPYQKQMFALISKWVQKPGRSVISVVHDLSLAKAYGTHGLLIRQGKAIAQGDIHSVLQPEHLSEAYAMDVYAWMQSMYGQWDSVDTRDT